MTPLNERIYNYRHDPYFPTALPLAVLFALRDHARSIRKHSGSVWYKSNGQPRRFKPSNFNNPVTRVLTASMLTGSAPRNLKLWERVLLSLGF